MSHSHHDDPPPPDDFTGGVPIGADDPFDNLANNPARQPDPHQPDPPQPSPSHQPPHRQTNTLATLSVVFAFLFAPAGVILAYLGLRQIRRSGQRGHDRALIGMTLSAIVTAVAVAGLVIWATTGDSTTPPPVASPTSTPAPAPAAPTAPTSSTAPPGANSQALDGLLLNLDELKAITGVPDLANAGATNKVALPPATITLFDPARCASSFANGAPPAYDNTGYRAFLATNHIQSPRPSHQLSQAVAAFDNPAAAQNALTHYIGLWNDCANTRLQWTHVQQGEMSMWTLGAPTDAGAGVTTLRSINDGSPVSVTRAIGAKANKLVDIWFIGPAVSDQAATVAKRVLDRIPT